jgi:hypothetical protein
MAKASVNTVRIRGIDGDVADVTSNRLDVNATLVAGATIDIGDVEIKGHAEVGQFALEIRDSGNGGPTRLTGIGGGGVKHADIMANLSNTGIIYIGITGVGATTGIALYAGDVYSVDVENTNLLYALATVDQEDINVVYYK